MSISSGGTTAALAGYGEAMSPAAACSLRDERCVGWRPLDDAGREFLKQRRERDVLQAAAGKGQRAAAGFVIGRIGRGWVRSPLPPVFLRLSPHGFARRESQAGPRDECAGDCGPSVGVLHPGEPERRDGGMGVVAGHDDAAGHNGNLDVGHGQSLTERAPGASVLKPQAGKRGAGPGARLHMSAVVANDQ